MPIEPGVPVYKLTNTELQGRYRIEKEVFSDPYRNVVLQRIRFVPLQGTLADYRLYALLAPHLANCGRENTGWVGDYKGTPMLFAHRNGLALAFACSTPWRKMSVGFAGFSDGWQDLSQHYQMTWDYTRAENGNVALTGEIDLAACNGEFTLALGFGGIWSEAGQEARSSLLESYDELREHYVWHWKNWQDSLLKLDEPRREVDLYRTSVAVMRSHESKDFLGGVIASLSIPWGFNKGDEDLGGYHLVWPRDLVETAFGLLAAGAEPDALRVLRYLEVTQEPDGHWAQNMWLDGRPYWNGMQMDETAFPILLVDMLRRHSPFVLGDLATLVGPGQPGRRLHRSQRPGHPAGSLGRRRRLFAVYSGGRNLRAARRRRSGRRGRTTRHRNPSARDRRLLERQHRALGLRQGQRPGAAARSGRLLRADRAARLGLRRFAAGGICPHQEPAAGREHRSRRAPDQSRTRWPWCDLACARRTIRES